MRDLKGSFASIVTPFTDDGMEVSEIRLARLVRHLASQGVAGIVVCTECGERTTMPAAERKLVVEIAVREAQGAVPIIADASANSTATALDIAQHAARHGARAAVVEYPAVELLVEREYESHVRSIAQYAGLGIVVVDARSMLSDGARDRLVRWPAIAFATAAPEDVAIVRGDMRSDEFSCLEFSASPLAAFGVGPDRRSLGRCMREYGRARTAKAAVETLGIDVGGLRSPLLPLTGDARTEVESACG